MAPVGLPPGTLDEIDQEILTVLSGEGRISWQQLGPRVGLSPNAAAERVKRLERLGIVSGYQAIIDPVALGRGLEAYVAVKMHQGFEREPFEKLATTHDAIIHAVHLTGSHDYLIHVRCTGTDELDDLLMGMKAEVGVADTETRIVLRRLAPPAD
jgi:Lrp/AsnC family leucine-responsive transcriptional regulator